MNSEQSTIVCAICGQNFSRASSLYRHQRNVHQKIRRYRCDKCGYEAGQLSNLERHKKAHKRHRRKSRKGVQGVSTDTLSSDFSATKEQKPSIKLSSAVGSTSAQESLLSFPDSSNHSDLNLDSASSSSSTKYIKANAISLCNAPDLHPSLAELTKAGQLNPSFDPDPQTQLSFSKDLPKAENLSPTKHLGEGDMINDEHSTGLSRIAKNKNEEFTLREDTSGTDGAQKHLSFQNSIQPNLGGEGVSAQVNVKSDQLDKDHDDHILELEEPGPQLQASMLQLFLDAWLTIWKSN